MELVKSQITKLKSQINSKSQYSNPKQIFEYSQADQSGLASRRSVFCLNSDRSVLPWRSPNLLFLFSKGGKGVFFENWNLDIVCYLLFGAWDLLNSRTLHDLNPQF